MLLILALPLQGAAAARMLFCGLKSGVEAPSMVTVDSGDHAVPGPGAGPRVDTDHSAHGATSDRDAPSPHGDCGFCVICLHASAAALIDAFAWLPPPSEAGLACTVSAPRAQFLTGAPDRPPSLRPIA